MDKKAAIEKIKSKEYPSEALRKAFSGLAAVLDKVYETLENERWRTVREQRETQQ